MDDEEENFSTLLAYTKSPKITKRTSFQDELKKAVSARVSRQPAIEEPGNSEYSDEFESDGSSDSLDNSFLKKTNRNIPKQQKSLRNFHFSDDDSDDSPRGKVSFLKTKRQPMEEPDYSVTKDHVSKGDHESGLPESPLADEARKGHVITEDKSQKPTPKPRESRMKHSPSPPGSGRSTLDVSITPTPQHRNRDAAEEKHLTNKPVSLSAPSSLTRLNDKVSASETPSFSERCSPEGFPVSDSPKPTPRLKSLSMTSVHKEKTVTKEETVASKDLHVREADGQRYTESHVSGRASPSVLEMMLTDVKEKSIQQENGATRFSESLQSNDSAEINVMLDKVTGRKKDNLQMKDDESSKLGRSQSNRSLSAPQSKKTVNQSKLNSAKSRYLGTLTILNKSAHENNGNLEAADTLRATVYQNWLEKKNMFLQELHKVKKAEEERENEKLKLEQSMKKDEAHAAFMAWKTEKKKSIQEIKIKQKQQETKKLEEFQDIARKKEESRKAFEMWKMAKEDHLKRKALTEKRLEKEKKEAEQDKTAEKMSNNKTAYNTWNERKELVLKENKKKEKNVKLEQQKQKSEKEEKEKRALEIYEQWLEKKEHQEKTGKRRNKYEASFDDDSPPPWSPPGRTIPAGR